MKGKLIKTDVNYILEDDKGIVVASTSLKKEGLSLSLKNCQAIERGYDLEDIKRKVFFGFDGQPNSFTIAAVERTIQIMVELMGDKKFTEEDLKKSWSEGYHRKVDEINGGTLNYFDDLIQSIQQNEWDVTVEREYIGECNGNNDEGCFQDSPGHNCGCFERRPKLDADGCLILKGISK